MPPQTPQTCIYIYKCVLYVQGCPGLRSVCVGSPLLRSSLLSLRPSFKEIKLFSSSLTLQHNNNKGLIILTPVACYVKNVTIVNGNSRAISE